MFDATFNNALVNRLATSSIVADAAVPALSIAFGAPARIAPSRSRVLLRVAPFGFSAVAIGRPSCTAVSSTGTAFPCPPGLDPARSAGITPPSGTTQILGLLLGHRPSSFRSPAYRQHIAGTQQISWGEMLRFRRDHVANTPSVMATGIGHRRRWPARPPGTPYGASLSFATTTHLWPLPDPPSRKPPQRTTKPHWGRPVNSGPRPCLFDVGFPLSGLRDRTHTSDLNTRTQHTKAAASRLASLGPDGPPLTAGSLRLGGN